MYAETNYADSGYDSGADAKDNLVGKINLKDAKVAVVGLGEAGLPLAVAYALSGFHTIGIDTNAATIATLKRHESPFSAVSGDILERAIEAGLTFDTDESEGADADCLLWALPAFESKHPDLNAIENSVREIANMLKNEMLVMLESCRFPETMGELVAEQIHLLTGLKTGVDIFVGFSPKSANDAGTPVQLRERLKIVGGITPHCREVASSLCKRVYSSVQTHSIIPDIENGTAE